MCTIVVAHRVFPDVPVAVVANRDERLDRPASPPTVQGDETTFLAPRDEEAGGTWMGVNEHRLFVGLSNRWDGRDVDDGRSRGLLVTDVLGADSVNSGIDVVEAALGQHPYAGFNLLLVDRSAAALLEYDGTLRKQELDPGVHVLVNTGADGDYDIPDERADLAGEQAANADRVRDVLRPEEEDESADEWLQRGKDVLGDHEYGVCIHGDGYGTVSTSLVSVAADGTISYRYAEGPPCRTEAVPVTTEI